MSYTGEPCPIRLRQRSWWDRIVKMRFDFPHRVELLDCWVDRYSRHHTYGVKLRCTDCLSEFDSSWGDSDFIEHDLPPPSMGVTPFRRKA